jgi:hypothetical protein
MKDETFGNVAYLQMHHNVPPARMIGESGTQEIWCRTMWDYNTSRAAEIVSNGNEEAVLKAYRQMVSQDLPKGFGLPFGEDVMASVFHLLGRDEQFAGLVDTWAKEIQAEARQGVGGDDSHFDYFPDYVEGLHQLCSQIGSTEAKIAYNETLQVVLRSESYRDETEDLFDGLFELG